MINAKPPATGLILMPDLTPLLDIIFIVMVFLLLTANISVKSMKLDVPTTQDTEVLMPAAKDVLTINILAGTPTWALEQQTFANWDSFKQAFLDKHNNNPKRPLIIGADKHATVENMLTLLAFLQKNNINSTSIIMEQQQ